MLAEDAARELDELISGYNCFLSVGVDQTDRGEALFIYVRSEMQPDHNKIEGRWRRYDVFVRAIGVVRPLIRDHQINRLYSCSDDLGQLPTSQFRNSRDFDGKPAIL